MRWGMGMAFVVVLQGFTACPRPHPVLVGPPPPKDAGIETPVPEVDVREARLRPRKHHAPLALEAAESSNVQTGNGEDCTVYCATRFERGVGVTCQAWLDTTGRCHPFCYYENGWWFDMSTGNAIRRPDGTSHDQRPDQGQVPPFGYCSENGCTEDTFVQCPWKGRGATPPIQEFCLAMARREYLEGYNFCGQAP